MAEDLGESYDRHSAPIGASYHDYEEPLSSYERQCLDAEDDPDEAGEEGSGWGPDQADAAPALGDGLCADEPAGEEEGTWDSRFVDEDGQVQEHAVVPGLLSADEDDDDDDDILSSHHSSSSSSSDTESTGSPARGVIVSGPTNDVPANTASETPILSAPSTSTESGPCRSLGPTGVPDDHLDAPPPLTSSPSKSPLPPLPNNSAEPPAPHPASTNGEPERQWFNNQAYASPNNSTSKPVRAYDEYKQGLRTHHHHTKPWPRFAGDSGSDEDDDEEEEEGETFKIDNEDHLPFIRIPWPSSANDEILSRQEDAQVVEIRVGEEETLDSILRDIERREERRRKGKGVQGRGEEEGVGGGREDVVCCVGVGGAVGGGGS